MGRRRIGRTSVEVGSLGFGAAQIGNLYTAVDDETASQAVESAWAAGVRYFDTAPHYGLGLSERRLGAALRRHHRDEFVVSTKVGRLLVANPAPVGSDLSGGGFDVPDELTRVYDYSGDGVRRSLEASFERLQLDRVDIVYVHDPDDFLDMAISEAIPALAELRDAGVVGAVGVGMNYWQPLLRIVQESDVDAVMLAGRWTAIDRSGEPLLAECERRDVAVVAAAPFNSGLLARPWPADGAHFDYLPAPSHLLSQARALAAVCDEHGTTLPEVAMQFPLRHPAVATVVAGMRNPAQVASDIRFMGADVPQSVWPALDAVVAAAVEAG
jgi:D-threo-aldose 1-dehydrogenase